MHKLKSGEMYIFNIHIIKKYEYISLANSQLHISNFHYFIHMLLNLLLPFDSCSFLIVAKTTKYEKKVIFNILIFIVFFLFYNKCTVMGLLPIGPNIGGLDNDSLMGPTFVVQYLEPMIVLYLGPSHARIRFGVCQ